MTYRKKNDTVTRFSVNIRSQAVLTGYTYILHIKIKDLSRFS